MADSRQQTSPAEASAFGQDDIKNLHVGLLLFSSRDFFAIKDTLLPHRKVEDIVQFYCSKYTYTKASAHMHDLQQSGFQPGALVSGNMRNRVFRNLVAATGRMLKYDKTITSAFKAYDACSMPLVDLVEALTGAVNAGAFGRAVHDEMSTVGVDMDQLALSELYLDWDTLESKVRDSPELFESAVWPALAEAGWTHVPHPAAPATAAEGQDQVDLTGGDGSPEVCDAVATVKKQHLPLSDPKPAEAAAAGQQALVYLPPASVASDYVGSVGEALPRCSSPAGVLAAMREAGQAVPTSCIVSLREAELAEAVQQCLLMPAGLEAPHRHVHDPSAKRPGTPITSRKFMCANCNISTSTVWRTGNAGLTLCNACGMFYNKHDHEHRPEHLIASARAKQEAQQHAAAAAAAAGGSPLHPMRHGSGYTADGAADGDVSDDARRGGSCMGGSESDDEDGSRRPRTRRRAQVNKWLASDEYLMLDGPLRTMSNPSSDLGWSLPHSSSANASFRGFPMYDDARGFDGQRGRNTASPCFTPSYRPSSLHRVHQGCGYTTGRSRSLDPEYHPNQYERWQEASGYGYSYGYSRQHCQDGAGGYTDWGNDEVGYVDDEEQQQDLEEEAEAWQQEQAEERRLEDMESLLGRILINSPSDASDSSAADALVAMSQSLISQQEQHRLHAAISCDTRAASASPGPTSRLRRTVARVAAAAAALAGADMYSPVKSRPGQLEAAKAADSAGRIEQQQKQQPAELDDEEEGDQESDSGMDIDEGKAWEQEVAGAEGVMEGQKQEPAEEPEDGFAKAWARVQALAAAGSASGGDGSIDARPHSALAGEVAPSEAPGAWFDAVSQEPLQHCHSAPSQYTEELAEVAGAAAAAAGSSYVYGSSNSHDGSQYHQQMCQGYYQDDMIAACSLSSPHTLPDLSGYGDSGSRSASPTKAGRGSQRRQNPNIDEDYTDKPAKSKGRSISRFGAEHKQQLDHYSAFPHQGASPVKKASPHRAMRRTSTGEPVRCANCGSDSTCLWRRDKEDPSRTLCNACGIYKTNNAIDRPTNGLFPFWKNGKERVVRRNTARPVCKPYKHQVLTPEEYKAQRHQESLRTARGSKAHLQQQGDVQGVASGDIHPGALGLPAGLPFPGASHPAAAGTAAHTDLPSFQGYLEAAAPLAAAADAEEEADLATAASQAADPAALSSLALEARSSSPDSQEQQMAAGVSAAATVSSGSAAALSAAVAAATEAARAGSCSEHLNWADTSGSGQLAPGPWTAAVEAAVAAGDMGGSTAAAAPAIAADANAADARPAVAPAAPPEIVGWVQQMSEVGALGHLLHQAYTHAVRMGEPVMLTTGHKVFPDGKGVKCHVNNELGLMLPAGSQELAATVAQVAAAISSTAAPSGLRAVSAPKVALAALAAEGVPPQAAAGVARPH